MERLCTEPGESVHSSWGFHWTVKQDIQ